MSMFLNRCLFEDGYIPTFGDKIRFINRQSGFIYDKIIPPPARYLTFKSDAPFYLSWGDNCKFIASNDGWITSVRSNHSISSNDSIEGYYYIYLAGVDPQISDYDSYISLGSMVDDDPIHVSVSGYLSSLGGDVRPYQTVVRRYAPYLFYECEAITDVSELIISSSIVCSSMFRGCTNLTNTPVIQYEGLDSFPLANYHFQSMFYDCSSLNDASDLEFPDVQLSYNCYSDMFAHSGLIIPPTLQSTKLASYCYDSLFYGCSNLKVSTTETEEYTQAFRIPSSGTVTSSVSIGSGIFGGTGGTYTSNPVLNETYYLDISAYNPPK